VSTDILSKLLQNTATIPVEAVYADGSRRAGTEKVIREHRLRIFSGQDYVYEMICTRTDIQELVTGRLFLEGRIRCAEEIRHLDIREKEDALEVQVDIEPAKTVMDDHLPAGSRDGEHLPEMPTDGGGLKKQGEDRRRGEISADRIFRLIHAFSEETPLHTETGATHSAILMAGDEVVFRTEDISRHNALDKAVGRMLLERYAPEDCILFTSGRVPEDAMQKIAAAGLPVLVSKAIPTKEAVMLAERKGIMLIGRAWKDHYEVYADGRKQDKI